MEHVDLASPRQPKRAKFLRTLALDHARNVVCFTPSEAIIDQLMRVAENDIPGLASKPAVLAVLRHNPECIFAFARGGWQEQPSDAPMGFMAMLPLTKDGHRALFDGRLKTDAPDLAFVARQHERPDAIYHWGVFGGPAVVGGMALVMERLSSDKFRGLPMYCKAASPEAHKFMLSIGFVDGAQHPSGREYTRSLMGLPRVPPTPHGFDSYTPGALPREIGIKVVHDLEELSMVRAIRAAAYVSEQQMPYREDVDGNDLSATHLLGYIGDEPAGCIRIRYFAGFVKVERLAVFERFRKTTLALKLVRAAIEFGRHKGYTHFYGQAEESVIKLWERFGFIRREGPGVKYMTDLYYHEGDLRVEASPEAVHAQSGPNVLIRPEGQWHRPSHLEVGG
ncbi:MAG: GNAT family N-acetyltransferase [Phreatobacter sp.]|uniref:GNAT family N-acetyltransferase n=1 Tax=Phreatobacter sp. TaxID=1966341 RepID=UPI001A51DDB2|nr:GNAT family N-acetyltransferase [Phreatobacter sp.]MBL8570045.1 GNAT family N-acetyltransferase [Phreatobacter sp.]